MASMTTVLTKIFSPAGGNQLAWALPNHTALAPEVVYQRSKSASGNGASLDDSVSFVKQTTDANGVILSQKDVITISVRRSREGATADMAALVAYVRDFVAADEFTNMVDKQLPVGPA